MKKLKSPTNKFITEVSRFRHFLEENGIAYAFKLDRASKNQIACFETDLSSGSILLDYGKTVKYVLQHRGYYNRFIQEGFTEKWIEDNAYKTKLLKKVSKRVFYQFCLSRKTAKKVNPWK